MNILDAMTSKEGFGRYFSEKTWVNWKTYLSVLFGLPIGEGAVYKEATGLDSYTPRGYNESWVIVGRRGGKTTIASLIACYLALFKDYSRCLKPGETGFIFLLAVNMDQARILKDRIEGLLRCNPVFERMIMKVTADRIELKSGIVILVKPATFRGIRGATLCAALLEEISFLRYEEAAVPDIEIYRALKPGLSSIPGSMLIGISSPFQQSGLLYDKYTRWHGKQEGPLVWKMSTLGMHPGFSKDTVDLAYKEDPVAAATEYGADFRSDLSTYIDPAVVESCIVPGRYELLPVDGIKYVGAVDMSGGRQDSFTLGIAHKLNGRVVLDCLREQIPPADPDDVMAEFSSVFLSYRIKEIEADNYAADFVSQGFKKNGIEVVNTKKAKSELYMELLGPLNSGTVELLDNKRLKTQLASLDRRARQGRDIIDNFHGHDDCANVVALVCAITAKPPGPIPRIWWPDEPYDKPWLYPSERRERAERKAREELEKPTPEELEIRKMTDEELAAAIEQAEKLEKEGKN